MLYPWRLVATVVLVLSLLGGAVQGALATSIFPVAIDTTAFSGTDAVLAFNLVDGDAISNNTAIITNFSTNGTLGAAVADPAASVTGVLPGMTSLTDMAFFNELLQDITFGTTLAFTLTLTENFAGGPLPDQLAFFLLDAGGAPSFRHLTQRVPMPSLPSILMAPSLERSTSLRPRQA